MLAFDTTGLMLLFRSEVDDELQASCGDEDCLWKNAEVYSYMTEAVDAVMRLTGGTSGEYRVPYLAGAASVRMPRKVYQIQSAWLDGGKQLRISRASDLNMDRNQSPITLDLDRRDTPTHLMCELGMEHCVLYPTPDVDGAVNVLGYFTLGAPLAEGVPMPLREIRDQRLVLTYMKALAYTKHDAETYDSGRAMSYMADFNTGIQDRESEIRRNRRPPGFVKMDW